MNRTRNETKPYPTYGFRSGLSTSMGMGFAALSYGLIFALGSRDLPLLVLILPAIVGKGVTEWVFWMQWKGIREQPADIAKVKSYPSFFKGNMMVCLFALAADNLVELCLVIRCVKAGLDPLITLSCLTFSLALTGGVYGFVLELFRRKTALVSTLSLSMACLLVAMNAETEYLLVVLCCKGAFIQTTTVARAAITDTFRSVLKSCNAEESPS